MPSVNKLHRLAEFIRPDTLASDIRAIEKVLRKDMTGDARISQAIAGGIRTNALLGLRSVFEEVLKEKVEAYKFLAGDRVASEDPTEWDAGMDEAVEEATTPYLELLSQNWLGSETIDTQLHNEGNFDQLVKSFAGEAYNNITYKATAEDIMEVVGVKFDDVKAMLGSVKTKADNAADSKRDFARAVGRIAEALRNGYDMFALVEELENATDSDGIIADGAYQRITQHPAREDVSAEVAALQEYRRVNGGKGCIDALYDLILAEMNSPAPVEAPAEAAPTVAAEKPATKKRNSKKAEAEKAEAEYAMPAKKVLPPGVLKDIQEVLGADDAAMAKMVNVSRQTWVNYREGKRPFQADDIQYTTLAQSMMERQLLLNTVIGRYAEVLER